MSDTPQKYGCKDWDEVIKLIDHDCKELKKNCLGHGVIRLRYLQELPTDTIEDIDAKWRLVDKLKFHVHEENAHKACVSRLLQEADDLFQNHENHKSFQADLDVLIQTTGVRKDV